ncbi:histone acetyltransferase-like protein [Leishmania major strain Friedlin]|uniref:tRNA carboxymethyluridine synthase n=1 Tax=Leishmania major TaxID=5664 RepID=Q4QEZ6_LEIMA|nr:histone acetyltransferase-like protein [Leishmania major strain Friedlin]CAG9572058.1 Elongator-like_Protein_3a_-_putative [Leishmania major strain Friedlin]CAJ03454.1 histone acetyltransferase-like protein [Leishmania major strain Friedlin]|eukprot:XP_001682102.1 histone acetyltransferase-like protein [Leishmania major strain Friedlin]
MSSDSDTEGEAPSGTQSHAHWNRIEHKLANLPTLERLMQESDPNDFSSADVEEASRFVRDIVATAPQCSTDIEKAQRQLQRKYRRVFKKSLLLAGYKHLLRESMKAANDVNTLVQPHQESCDSSGALTAAAAAAVLPDMEDAVSPPPPSAPGTLPSPSLKTSVVCPVLERYLVFKAPRSQSGVLVVTVFTSAYPDGQNFSCQWNCYYCPNEPGQPRSYLLNEPGVRRANRLEFDPYRQFEERVRSLVAIGHPADKVELLVLGGTWESYPHPYRERFIRDLFYAANTMFDPPRAPRRPPLDLLQEQLLNESAQCKIIGVTLETRPDTINPEMLVELRRFGCTRVQLGVQHTDDGILTLVNRQSTREDTANAIKLLKDSCFKVDIHLMPDLPGASPTVDKAMFDDVLDSPYLQADQWKIYPCQTTPFSVIEQWYKDGKYTPYGLENLIDVLLYAKARVHPWIRINRVIRDIPVDYVLAGVEVANLRQLLAHKLRERGERCCCIRCREIKGDSAVTEKLKSATPQERRYEASEGTEVFLSVEMPTDDATILGFLRLRLNIRNWETPFAELLPCALIRELHVYGNLLPTYVEEAGRSHTPAAQHSGIGQRLLQRAEAIAREEGYSQIAVISGVGVRGYYKRRGYRLLAAHRGCFLVKNLDVGDGLTGAPTTDPQDEPLEFSLERDEALLQRVTANRTAPASPIPGGVPPPGVVTLAAVRTQAVAWYGQLRTSVAQWWSARKRCRGEETEWQQRSDEEGRAEAAARTL